MKIRNYLILLVLFLIPALCTAEPNYLAVHFLDIGQADCTLIKSPSGQTMLIDAGNSKLSDKIVKYLIKQGIQKIDLLIGTGPADDYSGSLAAVLKNFKIGQIYFSKTLNDPKMPIAKELATMAKSAKSKINTLEAGSTIMFDHKLQLEVLAPNAANYKDPNDFSPVIKLTYEKTAFLFAGAAGKQSETEMQTKGYNLRADVLKISQHGANTGTTAGFINAVAPKYAIISVDKGLADFPHPATLERLAKAKVHQTYRTDLDGSVIVSSNGAKLQITTVPLKGIL